MSGTSSVFSTNPATPSGDDPEFAGFEGMQIPGRHEDDGKDGRLSSHVVTSNKMLADLLDKKSTDPPFIIGSTEVTKTTKRKSSSDSDSSTAKRTATTEIKSTATSSAANAYAKLAASLLEDEDLEDEQPTTTTAAAEPQKSVIAMPMQRQIIVSSNQPPQMILSPTNPQIGHTTTTIKTESGYQTVPVIIQQGNPNPMANIQIQKQIGGIGHQIIQQPVIQQQQTQYVLATNQQVNLNEFI